MPIQTTLGDLVRAEPVFPRVLTTLIGQPAYHVAKLARLVQAETAHFHEQRARYIRELGAERDATPAEIVQLGLDPHGQPRLFVVTPAHQEEFQARMDALAAIAVEIAWAPLDLATLSQVAGADIAALLPLIAEDQST